MSGLNHFPAKKEILETGSLTHCQIQLPIKTMASRQVSKTLKLRFESVIGTQREVQIDWRRKRS